MHERDVALFDAIASALTATDVERALEAALREIVRALDLAAGWIWILDPESERFYLAAAHELPPYLREPVQMTGDLCWCMESFVDGDFDSKNVDIIACSRLRRGAREGGDALTGGLQSHASVALRFGERRLGIMNVCPPVPRRLSEGDLRLLSVAGAQIGLAVERGRLAEEESSAARSAERTRLAREIHDTLAQDLTAIALQLESALRDLPKDSPASLRVATALDVARASMAQARASVLTLRADPLEGRPLAAALGALARRLTSETGMRVTLHERGTTALPYDVEGELFRIASEALANARLHAKASRIEVELEGGDAHVTLRIRDDGTGFDPAVRDDERYGLRGMEERAKLAGGSFRVASERAGGTLVETIVPRPRA
ncbi:MAG: two-component system, NarL family, sensor kinase [Candidatus Eremiobacteraeota bacterium]|nr:two-component system, NarL family, sensor kinase [Candidatus Eremiobacteraeota bacterium]